MAPIAEILKRLILERKDLPEEAEIREDGSGEVQLVLADCTFRFFRDRNGCLLSTVDIGDADHNSVESWARYLGAEELELSVDKDGWVTTPMEVQLQSALSLVRRIMDEILNDPRQRELALQFMNGYDTAYTEWASGKWDVE